jgi:hypothetical protein
MKCKERSGFLFAHRCDHPVVASCTQCSKPVCKYHRRQHEQQELCISCHKQQVPPPADPAERQGQRDGARAGYYDDPYWFAAYHYSSYSYYDSRDYGVFDRADAAQGFDSESDWEAS